jgi:hypothetical protein
LIRRIEPSLSINIPFGTILNPNKFANIFSESTTVVNDLSPAKGFTTSAPWISTDTDKISKSCALYFS